MYGPGDVDISRLSMAITVEAIGTDELPWCIVKKEHNSGFRIEC